MKLSKKQAVYGGLLAVAGVALTIDRLFFSEPATAQASPPSAQAVPELPSVEKPAKLEPATVVALPGDDLISDHLKLMPSVDLQAMPDAFSPSKQWLLAVQPPPAPPPALPPAPPPDTTDHRALDFAAAHKLSAVLASRNSGAAIVNDQMVRVGQTLDGFTLTSVKSNTARFTSGSSVVDLTMGQ